MKKGLVLEGGGMRGLFSAGVIDAFMESGVSFDGIVGVSAGACFGCNLKSHQAGRAIRYNLRFAKDPRYCSWRSLFVTGDLFGADFCYRRLPEELDPFDREAFEASRVEFHVVATECTTGKAVYRQLKRADREAFEWIRASASMPLVSRPVSIGGAEYLDGGLSDGIPLAYFEKLGFGRNIVVTTRPRGYRKFPRLSIELFKPFMRRYPAIWRALRTRHEWYNRTLEYIEERERAGAVLLIAPPEPLPIGRVCHDPARMKRVYDTGVAAARAVAARIEGFLK